MKKDKSWHKYGIKTCDHGSSLKRTFFFPRNSRIKTVVYENKELIFLSRIYKTIPLMTLTKKERLDVRTLHEARNYNWFTRQCNSCLIRIPPRQVLRQWFGLQPEQRIPVLFTYYTFYKSRKIDGLVGQLQVNCLFHSFRTIKR